MSADIRLDPATLVYLSQAMNEAADGMALAEPIMRRLVQFIDGLRLQADAEARSPLLSDWLRACESSNLGPPEVSFAPHTGVVCRWRRAPHEGHPVSVRVLVLWSAMPRAEVSACHDLTGHPTATGWRLGPLAYTTPTELHAALDRLAAEARP